MLLAMYCRLACVGVPPLGVSFCKAVLAARLAASRTLSVSPALAGGRLASTSDAVVATQLSFGNCASPTRATGEPASGVARNWPITCCSTTILLGPWGVTGSDMEPDLSTNSMRLGLGWLKASGTLRSSWATAPGVTGSKS